ncbi:DUF222 domain-containing protein [Cellulomonas sp. McL0617]|uniref:HNH endonuclease signature motif containing protein n=1 Tax=Cellulomonas sp. McL0617 TaxID=3415675 RepID=UPI003CF0CB79
MVEGFEQLLRAVQAAQAVAIREREVRRPSHPSPVPDLLACALVTTRRAAELLMARASLACRYPAVHDAWAAGVLDARKVDVLMGEVMVADPSGRDTAIAVGVGAAARMTGPQLARHVRALVIAGDPAAAERRREAARQDRAVSLSPSVDGMAWLSAYLPAPDAVLAFTVLDALAGTTRIPGDQRSVDQRRADAFSDVFTSIVTTGTTPSGTGVPRRHGQPVSVGVTVAATTLAGLDNNPGFLDSFGPITAGMARELAQDGTWRRLLTDPATGLVCEAGTIRYRPGTDLTRTIIARDVTCTFPGCRQPATRSDVDHIVPFDPKKPAADQTHPDNLHALCRHHHNAKTKKHWQVHRNAHTGVTTWTSADGITFTRDPTPVLVDLHALTHHPHTTVNGNDEPPF